ncbi:hypothetical protein ACUSIJ_28090 [Pseudochelatococcus sp. B33]
MHTLRNAIIPAATLTSISIGGVFADPVVTETIFSRPGLGTSAGDERGGPGIDGGLVNEGGDPDRVIVQLGGLGSRIPALHDPGLIAPSLGETGPCSKPFPLDEVAAGRHGLLQILRREGGGSHGGAQFVQHALRLPLRVEQVASRVEMEEALADGHPHVLGGDGCEVEMGPASGLEHMPDQIVHMEALHDEDDGVVELFIEAGKQRFVEPVIGILPEQVGPCVTRLHGVIDNDDRTAAPGQGAAHGRRQAEAPASGADFIFGMGYPSPSDSSAAEIFDSIRSSRWQSSSESCCRAPDSYTVHLRMPPAPLAADPSTSHR